MGLGIDLVLGAVASVMLGAGLLMMKARGEALPAAQGRSALRSILAWLRDPMWLGGLVIQTGGYVVYIVALGGAPVSLVAVVMQGGLALFVLFAVIVLGERARPAEWLGIGAIILAVAMLAASLGGGATQGGINPAALIVVSVCAVVLGAAPLLAPRWNHSGAAPAMASGIAFGLGSLYTKGLADLLAAGGSADAMFIRAVASPYVYLAVIANVVGLVMLQNAFHYSRGIIAMPLSSAFSNVVPIVGGICAFGERLPSDPGAAALRVAAFAITIGAGALLAATRDTAVAVRPAPQAASQPP